MAVVRRAYGTDVAARHSDCNCRLCLSGIGAHKHQIRLCDPSREDLRGRDMNSVERPKGVCRDERFGRHQDIARDFNERPVRTIRCDTLQDLWHSLGIKRPLRRSASQSASKLDRHNHGCDHVVPPQKLQHFTAASLLDVTLDERAGIEVRPHDYARSWRSSMMVWDSGLPFILTGRLNTATSAAPWISLHAYSVASKRSVLAPIQTSGYA